MRPFGPLLAAVMLHATGSAMAAPPTDPPKAAASADYRVGDRLAPGGSAGAVAAEVFKLTDWDALMPKDWDPMKGINLLGFGMLRDGDPRANAALDKLRRAWDNAPTEPAMDGARIRIAGFVVPLDAGGQALREFLLVPYFGACIHTPPPPANQVIHVTLAAPAKGLRMMDAVWVSGRLQVAAGNTALGASGYRMDGQVVAPYQGRR